MRLNLKYIYFILFSFSFFLNCNAQAYKKVSIEEITSVEFKSQKNDTIQIEMICKLKNNAPINYKINGLDIHVFYTDLLFGSSSNTEKFTLKSKEITDLKLTMFFKFSTIESKIHEMMALDSIPLEIQIQGKASLLKIDFDEKIKYKISSQKITQLILDQFKSKEGFKLQEMKLKSMSAQLIEIDLKNRIKNILPFELVFKKINYIIYSDINKTTKIGNSSLDLNQSLLPDSSVTIATILSLETKNSLLTGLSKALSGKLEYFVVGELIFEVNKQDIKIPIKQLITIDPLTQEIKFIYG